MFKNPTAGYVAPFIVFVGLMAIERIIALPLEWFYPIRMVIGSIILLTISRPYWSLRADMVWASVAVGIAVFLIWIGPDVIFGTNYRHFWLFQNSLTGSATSSLSAGLKISWIFILVRTIGSTAVVPVLEELFWRGWLMRWLVDKDFQKVPLGKYLPSAFWITALLFASEHGPYWEVGLAAGMIYNWWLIRTKNLANCILAHAVTNGALAIYVIAAQQWQYWL